MEVIIKIFSNILSEHILVLIGLSVTWIFIYYLLKALKQIGVYLVIRFPYYLRMQGWRIRKGIRKDEQNIHQALVTSPSRADLLDRILADRISKIDKEISNKVIQKSPARLLFDKESFSMVYDDVRKNEMALLEKDHALSGIYSSNDRRKSSGLLNLIEHPKAEDTEILRALLFLVDARNAYIRENARYHFGEFVKKRKGDEKSVNRILTKLPAEMRIRGENLVKLIKMQES